MPLSAKNPRVAQLRRLVRQRKTREETGHFVIEGAGLLAEAVACGVAPRHVAVAEGSRLPDELRAALDAAGADVFELDPSVLASVASTATPQPVLASVPFVDRDLGDALGADTSFVVVADAVAEPGNAGTIIRTAAAAGADAVVFCEGSVDVFNPKVVRSTAGALFRVPVVRQVESGDVLHALGGCGLRSVGLAGEAMHDYDDVDLTRPIAVWLGNEAHGLGPGVEAQIDTLVRIPMAAGVESLNVAGAAAVVCFEVGRQRRAARAGE